MSFCSENSIKILVLAHLLVSHSNMSIKNIVVTANSLNGIDIEKIHRCDPVFITRNVAFGSINFKMDTSSLCQLFKNGKIIVMGGTSEFEARELFDRYMSALADLGSEIQYTNYKIQNIVACYKHPHQINLPKLACKHIDPAFFVLEFEPELFPAVRFRDNLNKVTVNIFHTGSCVILGAKDTVRVENTVRVIKRLLQ